MCVDTNLLCTNEFTTQSVDSPNFLNKGNTLIDMK